MIDLSQLQIIEIFLVALLSSCLQTMIGFGFGIISIPLFLLIGLSLPQAVLLVMLCSFIQTSRASRIFRNDTNWTLALQASITRLLFMPLGAMLLQMLSESDARHARQFTAIMILVLIVSRKVNPKWLAQFTGSKASAFLFWACSGFMATSIGIGGPPLVIWTKIKNMHTHQARAFVLSVLMMTLLPAFALTSWRFAGEIKSTLFNTIFCLPAIALGLLLGKKLVGIFSPKKIEQLVYLFLSISALRLLF